MKIICVIPARYGSTRLQGKPLEIISGKPMIYWVYNNMLQVKNFDNVIIATDHIKIVDVCVKFDMNYVLTKPQIQTPTERVYQATNDLNYDVIFSVNGDEPLIKPDDIDRIIKKNIFLFENTISPLVLNAYVNIKNPVEAIDPSNLKIVTDANDNGIYISRNPIPFPHGNNEFNYKKHIGVYAFNNSSLKKYHELPRGSLEKIENIDLLRFIENKINVVFARTNIDSISVDTSKDLETVRDKFKGIKIKK